VEARSALLESLSVFGNPSGIHKEGVEAGLLLIKGEHFAHRYSMLMHMKYICWFWNRVVQSRSDGDV
jgi:hypothetical protein